MSVSIDAAWKSLNKHQEELCGDKVEILKTEESDILILADGMGSGVKANILATLTSRILGTMLREGAQIESCVETIARTLPVCSVRKVAYATFSILQIYHDSRAYLAEFDNPSCIFIRNGRIVDYPYEVREIGGKKIHEYNFTVQKNDCFILMSDGVVYAGAGSILDLNGWTWEAVADYALKCTKQSMSASRLAVMLSQACEELYEEKPGDDTTVAVARVIERKIVNIFTGPPKSKEDDGRLMHDFMHAEGKKVVAGGTSANIATRILGKEIVTRIDSRNPDVPPTAEIEGIDLVTEGVLTLGGCLKLLKKYVNDEFDAEFFDELDADNGASRLAKLLIEECTELNLFVGTAVNAAHQETELNFDLSMRQNLVDQLIRTAEAMGKTVKAVYY